MTMTVTKPASAIPSIRRVKFMKGNEFAVELTNGKTFTAHGFRDHINARNVLAKFGHVKDLDRISGLSDAQAVRVWREHIDSLEAADALHDTEDGEGGEGGVIHDPPPPNPKAYQLVMLETFHQSGVNYPRGSIIATVTVAGDHVSAAAIRNIMINLRGGVCDLRPLASVPA